MKQLFFLLSFILSSQLFGQKESICLSKQNIKQILKSKKNDLGELHNETWNTNNIDSLYFKSDTIYLYNNTYMYLSENWCKEICWNLKENKITIIEQNLCIEPPLSTISGEKSNLKYKIEKENGSFFLTLDKGLNEYSKFEIIRIERIKLDEKEEYIKMTLFRKYEYGIYMELPEIY